MYIFSFIFIDYAWRTLPGLTSIPSFKYGKGDKWLEKIFYLYDLFTDFLAGGDDSQRSRRRSNG